jgi:zinc transport system permease protein
MLGLRQALFAVCNDEEYARVSGLPVRTLNLLMAVTTAVTVTIAMRTVGLLLVSALMVVPVAAAQQVTRGFASTMAAAMAIGVGAAAAGVTLAGEVDTAPGATIVILAIAVFLAITVGTAAWRVVRRRASPAPQRATAQLEPAEVVLRAEAR